jgi:long-chain acyl-CoA synthetase
VHPDHPAIMLMGSGTTGQDKLIVGTHKSYITTALQIRSWIKNSIYEWDEKVMLCVPLFHAYGNVTVQTCTFVSHNTLCLTSNLGNIEEIANTILEIRPSMMAAVPAQLSAIAGYCHTKENESILSSIKVCFSGGAALPSNLRSEIELMINGKIIEGYSLTEAMMASVMNPVSGNNKQGSVGLPLADVEIKIVEQRDNLQQRGLSEVGEIAIKAPQLMIKYWNNEPETKRVLQKDTEGHIWLLTGDLGMIDKDGFLFVMERKKDLIEVGNVLVFPSEIERVLLQHSAIVQAGVTGMPSQSNVKYIQAWVVLRNGINVTPEDIKRYCNQRLPVHEVPQVIKICNTLPTSSMGKVIRNLLNASTN